MRQIIKREHRDWSEELLNIIHEDGFFVAEDDLVIFEEKIHDRASKFPYALQKDLTERFLKAFEFRNGPEQNFIIALEGKKRRGKSKAALKICKEAQCYNNVPYYFTYNKSAANAKVKVLFPHSTIVIDENLALEGKNAINTLKELYNLIAMCGKYMMNFVFNIQEFIPGMKNVDIVLEIFGYNLETGVTRCMWRNPFNGKYLGRVYLDMIVTDDEYQAINKSKDEKWDSLTQNDGIHTAEDDLAIDETMVNELIAQIQADPTYCGIYKLQDVRGYLLMKHQNKVPNRQLKAIASLIAYRLDAVRRQERQERQQQGGCKAPRYPSKIRLDLKDEAWREIVLNELRNMGIEAIKLEAYELSLSGMNYDVIGDQLGLGKSTVGNYITPILENGLGYAMENAYDKKLTKEGRKHEMGGKNTAALDCIANEPLEVISIKGLDCFRMDKIYEDLENYVQFARENHCPCVVVTYEMRKMRWRIFEVFYEKNVVHPFPTDPSPTSGGVGKAPLDTPSYPRGQHPPQAAPAAPPAPTASTPPVPIARIATGTGGVQPNETKRGKRRKR